VPPHRWVALAAAATVTALAVGGSLGVVPGVALGVPPSQVHVEPSELGGSADAGDAGAADDDVNDPGAADADSGGAADLDQADPGTSSGQPSESDPALPAESGSGKRVVYDISAQRVWLVHRDGSVARTYPVSGALDEAKLVPDTYQVTSKSRHAVSYNYRETMDFMVRFAQGERAAIGFHDIPRDGNGDLVQTRGQLGTPLSAGCVRQWRPDAISLWRFTEVGTTVVVVA
jgi:lipoprotein-anchoring transpeptidase ErfK/SrfK